MTFLKAQMLLFHLMGYDLRVVESTRLKIYTLVNLFFLTAILFPESKFVTDNISDIELASDGLCTLLTGVLCVTKLITIRLKKKYFYQLIWSLQDKWSKGGLINIFFIF